MGEIWRPCSDLIPGGASGNKLHMWQKFTHLQVPAPLGFHRQMNTQSDFISSDKAAVTRDGDALTLAART